jgi:hypothetical protein
MVFAISLPATCGGGDILFPSTSAGYVYGMSESVLELRPRWDFLATLEQEIPTATYILYCLIFFRRVERFMPSRRAAWS